MTDVLTKKQRSFNMSRIRGKWTKQEKIIHNKLKGKKIRHKMHPQILGKPDIILKDSKVLVFLDGCFWHKCPECFREPENNKKFWKEKIDNNVQNDKYITSKLVNEGWRVLRIWEHEIKKDPEVCINRIEKMNIKGDYDD